MEGRKASEINPERKDYDFLAEQKAVKPEYDLLEVGVYPGAKPTSEVLPMMKVQTSLGLMCTADWTTDDPPEKLIQYYKSQVKDPSVIQTKSGPTLVGKTKSDHEFTLSVSKDGAKSKFSITVVR